MLPEDLDALYRLDDARRDLLRAKLTQVGDAVPLRHVLILVAAEQAEHYAGRCERLRAAVMASEWRALAERLRTALAAPWLTSRVVAEVLCCPQPAALVRRILDLAEEETPD